MSLAENTQTVSKYNWSFLPEEVIVDYIKTVYKESHRLPDEWTFLIKENGLYDSKWNSYIQDVVNQFPHPNLYLREVENSIIQAMDSWSISDEPGSIVWISPIYEGMYPCNKIEIITKWPDQKGTNNVAINFDCSAEDCLRVAKSIFPELSELTDIEELRRSVIINKDIDAASIIQQLSPHIKVSDNIKTLTDENYRYIASLAKKGYQQIFIAAEMERLGMIGDKSFSCPGGSGGLTSVLGESSLNLNTPEDKYGSLEFTCPHCGATNTRPFGRLINNCQYCGGDVRC